MAFRLSQKNLSQILALTVLSLFFLIAIRLLDQKNDSLKLELRQEDQAPVVTGTPETTPVKKAVPNLSLQDFTRNSQEDGKLRWEIEGKTIDLFSDQNLIEIQQPNIKSYQNPEDPLFIKSRQALVLFKENQIQEADLKDSVEIKNQIYNITTEQAKFNQEKNTITSSKAVKILKTGNIINGIGLDANLNTEVFNIKSKVDSVIKDQNKKRDFKVTAEKLIFDNRNSVFTYTGNVVATDELYIIKSDVLTGNMDKNQELEKLFASGSVIITKGTNLRTFSEMADFDFNNNMIILREDPELEKDKSLLTADVIYYNTETEQSTAEGEVDIKVLEEAKAPSDSNLTPRK